ncbi:MAG: GNAT family N-acetyltransferase [Mesorhizobium sp.]|nr:GNAT family N-acetyltransferase [Mesorhizobium sp.]
MHVLVTKRLTLRQPTMLDAEQIAAGLSNWNVARMLTQVPYPYFVKDAEEWIEHVSADPGALVYTIHREQLIGVVAIEGGGPQPHLGYWLAESAHGHGYMTEAAGALIAHAFDTTPIWAIESAAIADNPASLRVQEKLGFAVTGLKEVYARPRGGPAQLLTTRLSAASWRAGLGRIEQSAA